MQIESFPPQILPLVLTAQYVVCPKCGQGTGTGLAIIDEFLMGNPLICERCNAVTNAWEAFLTTLNHRVPFLHDIAAGFIGFKVAVFKTTLSPGQTREIAFSEHGIPAGSRILRLVYTPEGPIHPIEIHGNEVPLRRARDAVLLYGKPLDHSATNVPSSPIEVGVYASFAEPSRDEYAIAGLARAFSALYANDYLEMVVPATMALEFTCKQLIRSLKPKLELIDEEVKDKELLSRVVPDIATKLNVPRLSDDLLRKISRLWGQRDSVAHSGRLHQPYIRENAVQQLAAAIFAFRYLQLLQRRAVERGFLSID